MPENILKKIGYPYKVFALIFLCYLYSTPYLAINQFRIAVEEGNYSKLSRMIDLISIRKKIKNDIKETLTDSDSLGLLNRKFITNITDRLIDKTITDNHIRTLFLLRKLESGGNSRTNQRSGGQTSTAEKKNRHSYKLNYISINRFRFQITKEAKGNTITGIWRRAGLTDWKLGEISVK